MEPKKLSRFILEQRARTVCRHEVILANIMSYTLFISQELDLSMFVPCDSSGKVWTHPPTQEEFEWARKDSTEAEQSYNQKVLEYNKALEKVLFKGYKIVFNAVVSPCGGYLDITKLKGRTIEDILDGVLAFSEAAIKQLNLK